MLAIIQNELNNSKIKKYNLPIEEIDGVSVCVEITKNDISIRSSRIYIDNECNTTYLGGSTLVEGKIGGQFDERSLTNMENILDVIEFDKFVGKFVLGTKGDEEKKYIIENEYLTTLNNKNKFKLKKKFAECCVCLENTMTKTDCNHFICIPCASRIEYCECEECTEGQDCCGDEECGFQKCPLCRSILFIH